MGISNVCCKKNNTVHPSSELPLHLDTNINNDEDKNEKNIHNKTFRKSSYWSKKNNELYIKTEQNGEEYKYKEDKDYFFFNFIKYIDIQNNRKSSKFDSEEYENVNTYQLHSYMRTAGSYPILILNIYNSKGINDINEVNKFKQVLKINPLGIMGDTHTGRLKKYDGESFFGVDVLNKTKSTKFLGNSNSTSNIQSNPISNSVENFSKNDFILDISPSEFEDVLFTQFDNLSKRIFSIKFDTNTLKYNIRDLHSGIPTLKSIKNETVLRNNSLIYIGESYIHISLGEETETESNSELINLKIYDKSSQLISDPMNFQPSKSCIRIGRFKDNEIIINDALVSRTHCTIQYDKVVGWTIRDGNFVKKMNFDGNYKNEFYPSTNGTWLYIGESTPIVDGTIFKCASLTFECVLEDN